MGSNLTYTARAEYCKSTFAKELLTLMDEKETNLCVSADLTTSAEILALAERIGPQICILKTHIDIVKDFSPSLTAALTELAAKHRFLIFEDRKFADIGHTVRQQYTGGVYRIADWAHIVNAHTMVGPGVIQGLQNDRANNALLLIAELSSAGHFMTSAYVQHSVALAEAFPEQVIGFITQKAPSSDPKWLNFSPGVQIDSQGDDLGQQYLSPETSILTNGADIIIVGRGIIRHHDPLSAAKLYRKRAYQAYLTRIGKDSSA